MSQPIDELMISVAIQEGSNLEELYEMLKEIQQTGKIKIEMPDVPTKQQITRIQARITETTNNIIKLLKTFPNLWESIKDILLKNIESLTKLVEVIDITTEDIKDKIVDIKYLSETTHDNVLNLISEVAKLEPIPDDVKQILIKLNDTLKILSTPRADVDLSDITERLDDIKDQCVVEPINKIIDLIKNIIERKLPGIARRITNQTKQIETKIDEMMDHVTKIKDDAFEQVDLLHQALQSVIVGIVDKNQSMFDELKENLDELTTQLRGTDNLIVNEFTLLIDNLQDLLDSAIMTYADELVRIENELLTTVEEQMQEIGGLYNQNLNLQLENLHETLKLHEKLQEKIIKEADEFASVTEALLEISNAINTDLSFAINEVKNTIEQILTDMWLIQTTGGEAKERIITKLINIEREEPTILTRPFEAPEEEIPDIMRPTTEVVEKTTVLTKPVERAELGPMFDVVRSLIRILSTTGTAEEAKEKFIQDPRVVAGIRERDITHTQEIIKLLELTEVSIASDSQDILRAIIDEVIEPYFENQDNISQNVSEGLAEQFNKIRETKEELSSVSEDIRYVVSRTKEVLEILKEVKEKTDTINRKTEDKTLEEKNMEKDSGRKRVLTK